MLFGWDTGNSVPETTMITMRGLISSDGRPKFTSDWIRALPERLRKGLQERSGAGWIQVGRDAVGEDQHGEIVPTHTDWLFGVCEPFIEDLVHRVDSRLPRNAKRVLQFIGADRGVGASTIAFAYASASATLRDRKVLLLSADELGGPGVLACVFEGRPVSDAISKLHGTLSYATLLGTGRPDVHLHALMRDVAVWKLISDGFDEVVVDCRPLDASVAAMAIASQADGVVVVIQAGRTPDISVQALIDTLGSLNARVLGAVLNQGVADSWRDRDE